MTAKSKSPNLGPLDGEVRVAHASGGTIAAIDVPVIGDGAKAVAQHLGYDGALTVGFVEDEIRAYQQRTVAAALEVGKRLLLLKELTAHGEFERRVEALGFSTSSSKRFMAAASRVIKSTAAAQLAGSYAVQNTWAEAFGRWNHVPPFIYVDNGSGYKNQLMSDAVTGFYARAGVQQIIHAIPGNPHGKGWVERFFRIVKEDFLKLWQPEFYCGDEMSDEVRNRIVREVKAGRMRPPSLAQFTEAFNAWLVRYHGRPHPEDKAVTRGALWGALQPLPPVATVTELKRPAVLLMVQRASIKHGRRTYGHPDLHAFNGQHLVLEYDLMDDRVGVIRTEAGRWVCDAHLVSAIDAIAPNRLEEKRQARAADAMQRLEKKMAEQRARAGHVLDLDAVADATVLIEPTAPTPLPGPDQDDSEINLLDF